MLFHLLGNAEQRIGGGFGDVLAGFLGLEALRLEEYPGKLFDAAAFEYFIKGDLVLLDGVVVEVGVNDDGMDVAGDEQRGIL